MGTDTAGARSVLDEGADPGVAVAVQLRRALAWILVGLWLSSGGLLSKATPGGGYVEIPSTLTGFIVVVGVLRLPMRALGPRAARLRRPLLIGSILMAVAPVAQAIVWTTPVAVIGGVGAGATYVLLSAALTIAAASFDDQHTAGWFRGCTVANLVLLLFVLVELLLRGVGIDTGGAFRGEHMVRDVAYAGSPLVLLAGAVPTLGALVCGAVGVIGLLRTTKARIAARA